MPKRHTKRRYIMRGGAFSQQEIQQLQNMHFQEEQIEILGQFNVTFNEVMQRYNTLMNSDFGEFSGNIDALTDQIVMDLLNEHDPSNQISLNNSFESQGTMDVDELNVSQNSLNNSFESQGTMDLDELNVSQNSLRSGYTTDESQGGKRKRKSNKKRKTNKKQKTNKKRKTRKQRGGTCFGSGVGANNYDPNLSIYNTNMLKLFPYRTN
jgi:hypothetical protein